MGLFGSLFTGVSALFAQSQNTAIISNNIANVNTTGYKRSEASFNSLVTTQSGSSRFSPGTASVSRLQRVDEQGAIQQTGSSTDAAISGNGFFPVKRSTQAGQEFLYTRAGTFSEDASGILRNASGFILYAWPIDTNGNLPANQGDLTSLVPADVAFLGGLTRPTTSADLAINLDADQTNYVNDTFNTPSVLPIPDAQAAHFTRGLTVFDSLGSPQTITFEFRKIIGPMAHFVSNSGFNIDATDPLVGDGGATLAGVFDGIDDNDVISISVDGAAATTFEFVNTAGTANPANTEVVTMQDLLDGINAIGTLEARLVGGQLQVQATDPAADIEIVETTGTPLTGANSFLLIGDVQGYREATTTNAYSATTDALTLGTDVDANDEFTISIGGTTRRYHVLPGAGSGAQDVSVTSVQNLIDDIAANFTGILTASLDTDSGRIIYEKADPTDTLTISDNIGTSASGDEGLGITGTNNFLFESEAPISPTAGTAYSPNDPYSQQADFPAFSNTGSPNTQGWWEVTLNDPSGISLTKGLINFNSDGTINAATDANGEINLDLTNINWGNGSDATQDIAIDISRFSQFAGNYDVIFSDQNGAELGLRTGVELTREGRVVARFSNGASADLYQVPLVTFANANGLTEVSGTAYSENESSGEENLREAGAGGAGFVEPSTLESSNVDLADEFARLIVSQRAFGAATRTINTVDQMTQDLLSLRG